MYFRIMASFAEPLLTRSGDTVCREYNIFPPALPELPELREPKILQSSPVEIGELVLVDHPRILLLENYLKAGWKCSQSGTYLRKEALSRLIKVAESLPEPWGLCVFDAWRPLDLQAELYETAYEDPVLPTGFVSPASPEPTTPPPHLTGGTVDCSFTLNGIALGLGTGFDDFTDRASTNALEDEGGVNRDLRRWLYWLMRSVGFIVLDCEWWHFEYGTRRWAAISNKPPLFGPAKPNLK